MQIQIIRAKSGAEVQYRNVFHAGYKIGRHHGVRGVYQGLQATWARNVPSFGIFFGCFEIIRDQFVPPGKTIADVPIYANFVAGGLGGLLYWVFTYPTDVIKSSMQSDDTDPSKRRFRGYVDCAKHLYKHEGGWRRFYKGYAPCMMRSVPANACQLFTLELCRKYLP